jgi:NTP pyrophosphatase (non-canonical NTP hydrolase)
VPQSDLDELTGRQTDGVSRVARCIMELKELDAENTRLRDALARARKSPAETQASISRWADETFGPSGSNARAVARANREMSELLEHVTSDDCHPEAAEEIADIVICLYRIATRLDVDLHDLIDQKMAKNRARKWRLDGTGHGYHIKED